MKVYWFVSNYPHAGNPQAGVFYRIFAEAMTAKGVELTVIAPVPFAPYPLPWFSPRWNAYHKLPFEEDVNGVRVIRPRYLTHPGELRVGIAHGYMKRAIDRLKLHAPDLVHGFGDYPASFVATKCAGEWGVPCATTFIGSDVNRHGQKGLAGLGRLIETINASAVLFTVSRNLSEKVEALSGRSAEVMPMPVKWIERPSLSRNEIRKKWAIPDSSFIVLFAGYLNASKGVNELCDALASFSVEEGVFGVFAGGRTPLLGRIEALTNASWLGQLTQEELFEIMCASDVLVLPSYSEGTPGVIKEAGIAGLPVIASGVGGIPEMLNEERGWIIEPKSANAIRDMIRLLRNENSLSQTRSAKLREFVRLQYGEEVIANRLLAAYLSLTSQVM